MVTDVGKSHIFSTYFAPRGRNRIFQLGRQIAQLYLSPFDLLIGFIGEAGSGKSAMIKGMFPGLELTNDDDGVNVRPLPLLELDMAHRFFAPHTYHIDIRFEMGFTSLNVLADAILDAIHRGRRVIVEHFDLIYPYLHLNANLLIGIGEEVIITRPHLFGPDPKQIYDLVYSSLPYRLMAHTAEDLCEIFLTDEQLSMCTHGDVRRGFILSFLERPELDIFELEDSVNQMIAQALQVDYADDSHIKIGDQIHECTGPRTHVRNTGDIVGFRLLKSFIYDRFKQRYLLVGCVGEDSEDNLQKLEHIYPSDSQD